MSATLKGLENLEAHIARLRGTAEALAEAMHIEALAVLAESQKEVPVDTGRLRSSGRVIPPQRVGDTIRVTIGYGTDYAIYVHENTSAHHPTGKAKFLEGPLKRRARGLGKRLAKRTRAALKRQR